MDGAQVSVTKDSSFETMTLDDLRQAVSRDSDAKVFIKIPQYQRGIVWSPEKKRNLFKSIYQGFPIGALLCHETRETESTRKDNKRYVWDLVDGLQRTSTLKEFLEKPLSLIPVDQVIEEDLIFELLNISEIEINDESINHVFVAITNWCQEVKVTYQAEGFDSDGLYASLLKSIPNFPPKEVVSSTLKMICDIIARSTSEILNLQIPIILYSGPSANVPEIFKLVNSTGTQLTKYQVFAATWSNKKTLIKNEKIKEAIRNKYLAYTEEGFEVQGFEKDEVIPDDDYNLYEYLYGLGQVLATDPSFGALFPDPAKDTDSAAAVAFNMATVAHGLKVNEMNRLASVLRELQHGEKPLNLERFEIALIESCKAVWKALSPFVELKLNSTKEQARITSHSQNQILSLILRYMVEAYEVNTWISRKSNKGKELLAQIPHHYLYDIIAGNWRGSGDKRLWEVVWATDTNVSDVKSESVYSSSSHYFEEISKEKWTNLLTIWFEDQLAKKQTSRANLTEAVKAFLRYIYTDTISHYYNRSSTFHIEHLYPVKKLADRITNTGNKDGWPISHIGNLCLLEETVNTRKGEEMIGDFLADQEKSGDLTENQISLIGICVIDPKPSTIVHSPELTLEQYLEFCEARFEHQKNSLFKVLNLN